MSLHAISFFDKVYKLNPEKIVPHKHHEVLQKSENRQVTRFTILISLIDCCVRIKGKPDCLLDDDIQSYILFL